MLLSCAQIAALMLFAVVLWTLGELQFLAPYRAVLIRHYLVDALVFVLVFYANLVAVLYGIARAIGLGHTGRRLQHMDRQLRTRRDSVNPELTNHLLP